MSEFLLIVPVKYDKKVTDPEAVANAFDTLLKTATSIPEVLDEYGNPHFGPSQLWLPNCVDLQIDAEDLRAKSTTLMRIVVNMPDGRKCFAFVSVREAKHGVEFILTTKSGDMDVERKAVAKPREVLRDNTEDAVWL
jgi:hypothetical protein